MGSTSAMVDAARHAWTAEEYQRASEAGVFPPGLRTELIEGEILEMSAQGADHVRAVLKVGKRLRERFAGMAHVRVQMTLPLGARRVPEPDLAVVRGDEDDAPAAPPAADVLLIVEVSDWTLAFDRADKARMYARSGVADYWVVNLRARQVEVHRGPDAPGYADVRAFAEGESVRPPLAPPDAAPIPVTDLLPPPEDDD
uniref:Putative restriction endonuclease domain-containing protein n=1 Tax=uncultured Armatimonadetes bacterium TaxID=157466 RepID=A0A6J4HU66_9BACT|nr:hypothetical protein AVDCRST_MAG63-1013 [uncultured Armatimonadetes bacterium]